MHSLGGDIAVMWIFALALSFLIMLGGALSLDDRETHIMTCGGLIFFLGGAIVVTIGQLIGWIGVW